MALGDAMDGALILEATAYHEAAHAVVACALGLAFRYVTLTPNRRRDSNGHLKLYPTREDPNPSPRKRTSLRERDMARTAVLLAGAIAEKRLAGDDPLPLGDGGGSRDLLQARDIACQYGTETETDLLLNRIRTLAERTVASQWESIQAVALNLLERNRLTCAEVRAIIESS